MTIGNETASKKVIKCSVGKAQAKPKGERKSPTENLIEEESSNGNLNLNYISSLYDSLKVIKIIP